MDTLSRLCKKTEKVLRGRIFTISTLAFLTAVLTLVLSFHHSAFVVIAKGDDKADEKEAVVSPFYMEDLEDNNHEVKIKVDGLTIYLSSDIKTIADALEKAGVTFLADDIISHDLNADVSNGMTITLDRVTYETFSEETSIPFETVSESSNELEKGTSQVKQEGAEGLKQTEYRRTFVNGIETAVEPVLEAVALEPVNKVVINGTKEKPKPSNIQQTGAGVAVDTAGVPINYSNLLTGNATGYTSDRGDSGTVTSTGQRAQRGIVAVDPKIIPYGTKLYITSADGRFVYGYAIAGDTGGACMSGRVVVDLFFDTYEECVNFGRRAVNVYVVG